MTDSTTRFTRLSRVIAGPALAGALLIGGVQVTAAQSDVIPGQAETCQADRSDHLFGGQLTGPLTAISDQLPFTIAGEQYPVCDEE